jgi:hypothetical protein
LLGARSRRSQWVGGVVIALTALAILPLAPRVLQPTMIPSKLWRPLHARLSPPGKPRPTARHPRALARRCAHRRLDAAPAAMLH